MRINSRQKGARAERAWASFLRDEGFDARRGCQFAGRDDAGNNAPDVVCEALNWLHFEVKHVQRLNLQDAFDQARRDAGDKVAAVAHKRNHTDWLITISAKDFARFLRGDLPEKG